MTDTPSNTPDLAPAILAALERCRQAKHPDLFTPAEAAAYLHLDGVSDDPERTLKTLRDNHGLTGLHIGKGYIYCRDDLDAVVLRLRGKAPASPAPPKRGPVLKYGNH